jgi:Peptidase family M23/Transglycosylase SLT domain
MTSITLESLIGKHCYFIHAPANTVKRVAATLRSDGKPRFHKWIHTQDPAGPQKCDWLWRMPLATNWSIRNYQQSEEVLTGKDQAIALGRKHAELFAAMVKDAVRQGIDPKRLWDEGRNEPQPPEMPFLNDYEIARMDRAVELGKQLFNDPKAIQLVLWNIPEGNPGTYGDNPQAACNWGMLEPSRAHALALSPDGDQQFLYGYHAYFGWAGPNEMWGGDDMKLYAIPYRISHCSWPEKKWLFTEGGCDEGVNGHDKEAWRSIPENILTSFGLSDSEGGRAQLYANHLFWLEQLFLLDGRIIGWTLFTDDFGNNEWWKFDTDVPVLDALLTPHVTAPVVVPVWGDLTVARWQPLIEHRASQFGLDPKVVAAIVKLESGGKVDAVGAAGDTGLMQVIDGEHMPGRPPHTVLLNPDQNVKAGCGILRADLAHFSGDLTKAIAAYNLGPGAVDQYGTTGPLAKHYLSAFRTAWGQLWTDTCPVTVTGGIVTPPNPPPVVVPPPPVVIPPVPTPARLIQPLLAWPLGTVAGMITQEFGATGIDYSRFQLIGHNGRDIAAPLGTPIYAAHAGVCWVYDDPSGYGLTVEIWDPQIAGGSAFKTIYGHMSKQSVIHGQTVVAGDKIGEVGSTGNSTGAHLHMGLKLLQGKNPGYRDWCDPVPFMDRGR